MGETNNIDVYKWALAAVTLDGPGTGNRFIPKIEPMTKELVEYLNITTFPCSLLDFAEQVRVGSL